MESIAKSSGLGQPGKADVHTLRCRFKQWFPTDKVPRIWVPLGIIARHCRIANDLESISFARQTTGGDSCTFDYNAESGRSRISQGEFD